MKEIFQARYSKDWLWLGLIVCAGITLRVLAIINYDHAPTAGDGLAYKSMALNFLSGSGIIDHMGNYAMYNMGYPFFILIPIFFLFGEENIVAVQFGNLFLSVIAIILCYEVAKEAGAGKLGRLVAAAIWALYLPASVYTVYFAKENLMIPLMLGVIWCAFRLTKQPSTKTIIGCGVLFGLLALTGNAALCLVATVVASLFFLSPALRFEKVRLIFILIVVMFAVASPWMIRNMHTIGVPILNTNGGFNLYLGNNPAATGWFVSIADTPRGETWSELRKIGEVEASDTLKHEAISWIKEHPSDFISLGKV